MEGILIERNEFILKMAEAYEEALSSKIRVNQAVLFAQAAHESGWGLSRLAVKANNLFGIKAGRGWQGEILSLPTKEFIGGEWINCVAVWRKYPSYAECILDYALIINTLSWYKGALKHLDNADQFLKAILPAPGKPGWATDPRYFEKVKAIGKVIETLGGPEWK